MRSSSIRKSRLVLPATLLAQPEHGASSEASKAAPPRSPAPYPSRTWYEDEKIASTYDKQRFRSPLGKFVDSREKLALARAIGGLPAGSSTCELACGTGRMTRFLLDHALSTLATDVSAAMIGQARARLTGVPGHRGFVRCDAAALPFKDGSFDVVVAYRFIAHLPPKVRQKVLSETARVSRSAAIFSAQSPWSLKYLYRRIMKAGSPINPPCALSAGEFGREALAFGLRLDAIRRALPGIAETYVARFVKVGCVQNRPPGPSP